MNKKTTKLALAGVFTAVAVIGSLISIPVAGSKCAPVQHMVNIFSAVLLGPWWGIAIAFVASLLRNLFGLGSFLAFPGSMIGAFCCGIVYCFCQKISLTCIAEALGTGFSGRRSFCLCDPVLYLYVCRQYFIICNICCLKKEWKPHTITGNGT